VVAEKVEIQGSLTGGPFAMLYGPSIIDKKISDGAFRTYALLWVLGDKIKDGWHSQTSLAKLRGGDRRTVNRHIIELKEAGLVKITGRPGDTNLVRISEPSEVWGNKISTFYSDIREILGCDKIVSPQGEGVTKLSQGGVTKLSHKVDKGEVDKLLPPTEEGATALLPIPTESFTPPVEGPVVSPGASDCTEDIQFDRWWDEVDGDGEFSPKVGKKKGSGKKMPSREWSLWAYYRAKSQEKWPRMEVPLKPVQREWGNLKKILDEYGEEKAKLIIDVAVEDWSAIRQKWPNVAQSDFTSFYAIFTLRNDLMGAALAGTGITTRGHRSSKFSSKQDVASPTKGWGDLFKP